MLAMCAMRVVHVNILPRLANQYHRCWTENIREYQGMFGKVNSNGMDSIIRLVCNRLCMVGNSRYHIFFFSFHLTDDLMVHAAVLPTSYGTTDQSTATGCFSLRDKFITMYLGCTTRDIRGIFIWIHMAWRPEMGRPRKLCVH